jgi:hypothetical protein
MVQEAVHPCANILVNSYVRIPDYPDGSSGNIRALPHGEIMKED